MIPPLRISDFRKSSASSPQSACVLVSRSGPHTVIWDDKLADPNATANTEVPPQQCLYFDHDDFDAALDAIRDNLGAHCCLTVTAERDGTYTFTASDPSSQPFENVALRFDQDELDAFHTGVRAGEFRVTGA